MQQRRCLKRSLSPVSTCWKSYRKHCWAQVCPSSCFVLSSTVWWGGRKASLCECIMQTCLICVNCRAQFKLLWDIKPFYIDLHFFVISVLFIMSYFLWCKGVYCDFVNSCITLPNIISIAIITVIFELNQGFLKGEQVETPMNCEVINPLNIHTERNWFVRQAMKEHIVFNANLNLAQMFISFAELVSSNWIKSWKRVFHWVSYSLYWIVLSHRQCIKTIVHPSGPKIQLRLLCCWHKPLHCANWSKTDSLTSLPWVAHKSKRVIQIRTGDDYTVVMNGTRVCLVRKQYFCPAGGLSLVLWVLNDPLQPHGFLWFYCWVWTLHVTHTRKCFTEIKTDKAFDKLLSGDICSCGLSLVLCRFQVVNLTPDKLLCFNKLIHFLTFLTVRESSNLENNPDSMMSSIQMNENWFYFSFAILWVIIRSKAEWWHHIQLS